MSKNNGFRLPTRRSTRILVNNATPTTVEPIEKLVARKRRRVERMATDVQLNELFEKLNATPMYEDEVETVNANDAENDKKPQKQESPLCNDDLLSSDDSDSEDREEALRLVDIASEFLEEEKTERLKQILLQSEDDKKKQSEYRFFKRTCKKLPDPLLLEDNDNSLDRSTQDREEFVYNLSHSANGRRFLLQSGCLRHWFRRGWSCPNYIYQWLFEIVAFEEDFAAARLAYNTLVALWGNLGNEPVPYRDNSQSILPQQRNLNRHISLDSFLHILTSYGAIQSQLEMDESEKDPLQQKTTISAKSLMSEDWSQEAIEEQRLPLAQLSLILRLFGYSVRTWPEAYEKRRHKYILRIFLQISMDRAGPFVMREIEDAVEGCLSIMSSDTWESELQMLAHDLCARFPDVERQLQLVRAIKPTDNRCLYLKRILAVTALERTIPTTEVDTELDSADSEYATASSATPVSNNNTDEEKFESANSTPSSPIAPPPEQAIRTATSSSAQKIPARLLSLLRNDESIFRKKKDIDYNMLIWQACLLDAAVGCNEAEFVREREIFQQIVRELQQIHRRIGGKIGVLERTIAAEVLHRLWNRLAYAIGRDSSAIEDHQI